MKIKLNFLFSFSIFFFIFYIINLSIIFFMGNISNNRTLLNDKMFPIFFIVLWLLFWPHLWSCHVIVHVSTKLLLLYLFPNATGACWTTWPGTINTCRILTSDSRHRVWLNIFSLTKLSFLLFYYVHGQNSETCFNHDFLFLWSLFFSFHFSHSF